MANSKITSKYQTTIPKDIRKALKLKIGDYVVFELKNDGTVFVKKVTAFDREYTKALNSTLSEWNSQNDEEDFSDLQNI